MIAGSLGFREVFSRCVRYIGVRGTVLRRVLALGVVVSTVAAAACAESEAAQEGQARDVAMFRGGATRNGLYAAPPGKELAGLQWRFLTEGDVVSSPTVLGQTVYVG